MRSEPLFLDTSIPLEKVAYDIHIEDDPDDWSIAIVREAYKQLPFLKSYETEVELDRIESSRGYGVGKMLVWPARMEKAAAASQKKLVVVPIIVRDRKLSPFDVYSHEGAMAPMDVEKLSSLMFRSEMFEGKAPKGQFQPTGLSDQIRPPDENRGGHGGTTKTSMLREIRPYVQDAALSKLGHAIANHPGLHLAYTQDEVLRSALESLITEREKTAADLRSERLESLKTTVVQVRHGGSCGYILKTANHACYHPTEKVVSLKDVREMLPDATFSRLMADGRVTFGTEPVHTEDIHLKTAGEAQAFGMYTTYCAGQEVLGVVVPKMVDFDNTEVSLSTFFAPGRFSMQEKVAGYYEGPVEDFEGDYPSGTGIFLLQDGHRAVASEVVHLEARIKTAGELTMVGRLDRTGEEFTFNHVPGLLKFVKVGNAVSMPASAKFVRLEGASTPTMSEAGEVDAYHRSQEVPPSEGVKVAAEGNYFTLNGWNAAEFREAILPEHEAEFALCALGLTGEQARGLLKEAASTNFATAPRTRPVVSEASRGKVILQKTAAALSTMPSLPQVDLTKELAVLRKEAELKQETVDSILSLGFITPENASIYCHYVPDLEGVQTKLAELLVASRLGMSDVREDAAKNAMTQVNAVVRGLKTLRERIQ